MKDRIYPSLEEMNQLQKFTTYQVIPIALEMMADMITPIEVMKIMKRISRHCFMLESVEDRKNWGRYTFLGYDPVLDISCCNHKMIIHSGMTIERTVDHPGETIREILNQYKSPKVEGMPDFTGGFVGYFSYDYIKYAEPVLKLQAEDEEKFQDVDLMLFDKVIAFDNYSQKLLLIGNVHTDHLRVNYNKMVLELQTMQKLLLEGEKEEEQPLVLKSEFKHLFSKEEYCEKVKKAKNYIKEGDIFQVVLSNRLEAEAEGSMLDVYRILRTTNPSPYMFYFASDDLELAGASPETLVKLTGAKVSTYPLAGSRRRGNSKEEDDSLEKELLSDEKECAEHNMLVDLGRNDIGKISKIGSVKVEKYMDVVKFSHIMHIGSTVTGYLQSGKDAIDAIDSILPAGTLSGAPKIRACEIINELENNKRGIYGGTIGYIDFSGNLDMCIGIRLAYKKNGKIIIRSGAGIVADSVPEKEFEECNQKARAVVLAVKEATENDITD